MWKFSPLAENSSLRSGLRLAELCPPGKQTRRHVFALYKTHSGKSVVLDKEFAPLGVGYYFIEFT